MDVKTVNHYAAKWTVCGWFIGLAYYTWFAAKAVHLPWWELATVAFVGMFATSVLIGGTLALIAAHLTKKLTGSHEGSTDLFAWGALISPVLAFFAAKYSLNFLA